MGEKGKGNGEKRNNTVKGTKSERINGIFKSRMDLRKRGRLETVDWFLAISSSRDLRSLVFLAGDKATRCSDSAITLSLYSVWVVCGWYV
jgi:hypothetical protein